MSSLDEYLSYCYMDYYVSAGLVSGLPKEKRWNVRKEIIKNNKGKKKEERIKRKKERKEELIERINKQKERNVEKERERGGYERERKKERKREIKKSI